MINKKFTITFFFHHVHQLEFSNTDFKLIKHRIISIRKMIMSAYADKTASICNISSKTDEDEPGC